MKKLIVLLLTALILGVCAGCGASDDKTITVIATPVPHEVILEKAKEILAEDGWNLEIIETTDYYTPNEAVNGGDADANFFQHVPFFDNQIAEHGYELTNVCGVHIEPMGFYSSSINSVSQLKSGDTIVISNSVADHGRVLSILAKTGVIKLKDGVDAITATVDDIVENPLNLTFDYCNPEVAPDVYKNNQGALVAINGNYAIGAGLNPVKDSVILEQADATNPYVNILVCRTADKDSPKIQALKEVLTSDTIKQFISDTYNDGSVIPAE